MMDVYEALRNLKQAKKAYDDARTAQRQANVATEVTEKALAQAKSVASAAMPKGQAVAFEGQIAVKSVYGDIQFYNLG